MWHLTTDIVGFVSRKGEYKLEYSYRMYVLYRTADTGFDEEMIGQILRTERYPTEPT